MADRLADRPIEELEAELASRVSRLLARIRGEPEPEDGGEAPVEGAPAETETAPTPPGERPRIAPYARRRPAGLTLADARQQAVQAALAGPK